MIVPAPQHDPTVGLTAVRLEIADACRAVGRRPQGMTWWRSPRPFGVEAIAPIIVGGQRVFGENQVQEAGSKWSNVT